MATTVSAREVLRHFDLDLPTDLYGNGHINTTYLVESTPRYILQRINTEIFKKPDEVMANIQAVTAHLRRKILEAGGDPNRETLTLIPTEDGLSYYEAPDGSCFRLYRFIENAVSYDAAETPEMFAASAHAFGKFQRMLADFPSDRLYETIPRFHDTGDRLRQFREALAEDRVGRASSCQPEIDFVLAHTGEVHVVTDAIADGSVPLGYAQ